MIPKFRFRSVGGMHEVVEIDFKNQKVWLSDGDQRDIASGVLMQSTGLLDKNGKEMFSGDIIKRDDQSQGKWRRFAVVKISPDIQFDCSPIKEIDGVINSADCIFHYGNFAYRDTEKYLEIMGNIYENPELINQ
ncbi:MAG: hypothetical protein DLD55_01180 [candidate division SR1 bacterium]|nr:MAG: hypothetical protein DLD55_01180 [candidate division SR1 bacterium]